MYEFVFKFSLLRIFNSVLIATEKARSFMLKLHNRNSTKSFMEKFSSLYGGTPLLVRSPGRINIIGEHTDYNEGFVLPAAIHQSAFIAITPREDDEINLFSTEFSGEFNGNLSTIKRSPLTWPNYILVVADQLIKRGYILKGFNAVLEGKVPIGAGLSSSASIECATVFALNEIFHLKIEKMEMVKIAQKAEHEFTGVMCGIMDQFASIFGKKDHVIKLDCRSLEYEYIPLKLDGIKIVLLNSNVKHSLTSSEYNTRRNQCRQGIAWIGEHIKNVQSLRDVNYNMLEKYVEPKDKVIYKRCRFVVSENERLLRGCEDLKKGNIASLGKKMFQTHDGLSSDYEVSCKELDYLVDSVKNNPSVLGARMMGGGFGGCTINLVKEEAIEELVQGMEKKYRDRTGLDLSVYVAEIANGTELLATSY